MSVVEIRKTKTREQGSYYCTLLQLYMYLYSTQGKTQGGYNVGQRTPLQGYRSRTCARVRPCVPWVSRLPPMSFYRYRTSQVYRVSRFTVNKKAQFTDHRRVQVHAHQDYWHRGDGGECL